MSDTDPGMELFVFDRIFSRRHWPGLALTCAIMVALAVFFVSNRDWRGVVVLSGFLYQAADVVRSGQPVWLLVAYT